MSQLQIPTEESLDQHDFQPRKTGFNFDRTKNIKKK